MARERSLLAPFPAGDVDSPALHEMTREPSASGVGVERTIRELIIEKTEESAERRVVAAVWRRGQQNEMPLGILRETPQQLEALLPILVGAHAGVRFVYHDKRRTGSREAVA